jgi:transcriptional regulator with XRE-family HTH domain
MPRIRDLRQAKGLTQLRLARRLGVSQQAVALWEDGARKPSLKMLLRLARTLGVKRENAMMILDQPGGAGWHLPRPFARPIKKREPTQ